MRAFLTCLMLLAIGAPVQAQSASTGANGPYIDKPGNQYTRPLDGLTFPDGKYIEPNRGTFRNRANYPDEDSRRGAVQSDGLGGSNMPRFRVGVRL
jgi:hypothetical protein